MSKQGTPRKTVKCNRAIKSCAPCPHRIPHKEHYAFENHHWDGGEPCTRPTVCCRGIDYKPTPVRCVEVKR